MERGEETEMKRFKVKYEDTAKGNTTAVRQKWHEVEAKSSQDAAWSAITQDGLAMMRMRNGCTLYVIVWILDRFKDGKYKYEDFTLSPVS